MPSVNELAAVVELPPLAVCADTGQEEEEKTQKDFLFSKVP